jgi:hypothetical protein
MIPVAVSGYFLGPRPRALVRVVQDWQIDQSIVVAGAGPGVVGRAVLTRPTSILPA